ncbi:MAG: apolipoprotein N-acyltransferase [Candidatus Saccharibacteria bacterium]
MARSKLLLLSLCSGCLLSIPWMIGAGSWIMLFAFLPLLIIDDYLLLNDQGRGGVSFFFYALVAFLTWNLLSTWWIGYVSLTGMLLIALINSFLMAGVWWIAHSIRRISDTRTAYFSLIVFWLSFEYLHFNWSMQWPWLTLGNGFFNAIQWIQWYEFTGALGGSLWILFVNIFIYSTLKCLQRRLYQKAAQLIAILLLQIAFPMGWSFYRYHTYAEKGNRVEVAVLQPNIDPYKDKFGGMTYEEQTQRLIALAQNIVNDSTRYVVAPETALAPLWENDSIRDQKSLRMFDTLFCSHPHVNIIAGAITQRKIKQNERVSYAVRRLDKDNFYEVYNSALCIDRSSNVQIGHKSILVSGVEKIPFQEYFSSLSRFIVDAGGTSGSLSPADQPIVFKGTGQESIGTVICFESAFGGFVAKGVKKGANILFVITNDGWWKQSAGLAQHFSYSRLRAVETRRSIARSANTGLSGFINERGDVIKIAHSNTATAINSSMTINDYQTFYVRHGDYIGWISAVLAVMIVLYLLGKKAIGIP